MVWLWVGSALVIVTLIVWRVAKFSRRGTGSGYAIPAERLAAYDERSKQLFDSRDVPGTGGGF